MSAEPLFWIRSPLQVNADPESYQRAGICAPLARGSRAAQERYDQLVGVAVGPGDSFRGRREIIDEYGWRHFGEIYADHESVGPAAELEPLVSHYNNQYDAIGGFATRFLLTGDHRWWTLADELAAHVTNIDLYHTKDDRAAYNGGYFWHTQHYLPAHTATHRAYSKRATNWGGGPSNEHNYTSGLMLHYFLTGSESSRAAVLQLGRLGARHGRRRASRGSGGSIAERRGWRAAPARSIFMGPAAAPATRSTRCSMRIG